MIYSHEFEKSSALASCTYNDEDSEMSVMFQSGKEYTYKDVLFNTYQDLSTAKSPGKHFASIKTSLVLK